MERLKKFNTPRDSLDAGIRVIYQEIVSFEPLTVAENIFAGRTIIGKSGLYIGTKWEEKQKKF